jgi:hypothetical protein
MTNTIDVVSPKFFKFAKKHFPESVEEILLAFEISIKHGGLNELNFKRNPEVSHNPRVARIPQIVFEQGKLKSLNYLLASILFSSNSENNENLIKITNNKFGAEVTKILDDCLIFENSIYQNNLNLDKVSTNNPVRIINICSFIDRFRHAHLSSKKEISLCLEVYPLLYSLIPVELEEIKNIFSCWEKRSHLILNKKGLNFD